MTVSDSADEFGKTAKIPLCGLVISPKSITFAFQVEAEDAPRLYHHYNLLERMKYS